MRIVLFTLALFPFLVFAEATPEAQATLPLIHKSQFALLSHEPIKDPKHYQDARQELYEAYSLRVVRGLYRHTGLDLEDAPLNFLYSLSLLLALAACVLTLKNRKLSYLLPAIFLAGAFFLIFNIKYDLYKLESFDHRAPLKAQKLIDAFAAKGQKLHYFYRWQDFQAQWQKGLNQGTQEFAGLIWFSIPHDFQENNLEQWLKTHAGNPFTHFCLGGQLPAGLQKISFTEQKPTLDWSPSSTTSIHEKATAYERWSEWQGGQHKSEIRIHQLGQQKVLYAVPDISDIKLTQSIEDELNHHHKQGSFVTPNLRHCAILRMDDPGAAQNAYHERWLHPELTHKEWSNLEQALLDSSATLSVGYTPAWVDDGNEQKGILEVNGKTIDKRNPGQHYPSHTVRYYSHELKVWYELQAQYEFLKNSKAIECELHGFSHITPETEQWLSSADKYSNFDWYREFLSTEHRPFTQRSAAVQSDLMTLGMAWFSEAFNQKPIVFIPPGHKISWDTCHLAGLSGLSMLSDSGIAFLQEDGAWQRCQSIRTYDLWEANKEQTQPALELGIPPVLLFHDIDISKHNEGWLAQELSAWQKSGVQKFISLRQLLFTLTYLPAISTDYNSQEITLSFPDYSLPTDKQQFYDTITFHLSMPAGYEIISLPENLSLEAPRHGENRPALYKYHAVNEKAHQLKLKVKKKNS
ncbi:MAG: hypothetical protein HQL32_16960 [Planctomycetes bacterium]|nr:hypothetical protein [Planctomycetota bacterium]